MGPNFLGHFKKGQNKASSFPILFQNRTSGQTSHRPSTFSLFFFFFFKIPKLPCTAIASGRGTIRPENLMMKLCSKVCKCLRSYEIKIKIEPYKPPMISESPSTEKPPDTQPPSKEDHCKKYKEKPPTPVPPPDPPLSPLVTVIGMAFLSYVPMVCRRPCYEGYE